MSLFRELSYDGAQIDTVKSIQFCLLDPDEIKRRSVVHVQTTDTYVGNEPVLNGLYDPRMGVTDSSRLCGTCEQRSAFCPGHFGHIELAQPVFYYQYMNFVRKILQCVCIKCSKLKYGLNTPEMQSMLRRSQRSNRWNNVHNLCSKVTVCGQNNPDGCGARNPDKITKNSIKGFVMEWKPGALEDDSLRKQNFGPVEVLDVLRRINDEDVEAMGLSPKYSRPEWMICTVLPVPPPAVRPCVHHETGQRQEDDLSYTLCHIIKNNNVLASKMQKGDKKDYIDGYALQLQYYVATLVENQIQGITPPTHKRSGRALRSLSDRLKGKEGRIRGNLMGKRVDFSARSVITPDPNISIDEVGVPMRIAMNLTFPETVSDLNRAALQRMVLNGSDVYPGAKMIRKSKEGGRLIRLKNVADRSSIVLHDGDIVERHLLDGDYVLFNRQPSLHRMSMMGHRVRVMPYNTFRISTSVCTSFNADFDGDEMNLHVPQSHTTAIELERLASVTTQIVSPKNSAPIISIVQDTVLGLWRMTQDDVRLDQSTMFNMLSVLHRVGRIPVPADKDEHGRPLWTGKQLVSCVFPSGLTLETKNSQGQRVRIVNGQILEGVLDASVYQSQTTGIVHSTFLEYGPDRTRKLFDDTQKLACAWLAKTGFSVGVSDLVADEAVNVHAEKVAREMKRQVYDMIDDVHAGRFKNPDIMSDGQYLETQINNALNSVNDPVSQVIASTLAEKGGNRMLDMIVSGSKGKPSNMNQMIGFLGQQNVERVRVSEGFDNRTLPHFTKFDDGPDAKGWVQNSFFTGLNPIEYFFHAMGGRDGLTDTSIKSVTRDTKIVMCCADGGVRCVAIGDWIDALMENGAASVKRYPEDRDMELLPLQTDCYVQTCDENGIASWGKVTQVTRHDPGDRIFRIETISGRIVHVADSESVLAWNSDTCKFEPRQSSHIVEGDLLPSLYRFKIPDPVGKSTPPQSTVKLNYDNGVFFGIYASSGSRDPYDDQVIQMYTCGSQQLFVVTWLEEVLNIQCEVSALGDKVTARVPAQFADDIENTDDLLYGAPIDFAKGFLHGLFDKVDADGSYLSGYDVTDRIFDVASFFARKFGALLTIDRVSKQVRLPKRFVHCIKYNEDAALTTMDVELDRVVSVTSKPAFPFHRKLYDVTVPGTLNFAVANGVVLRDTSDIGYTQRKLVKAMEDCKVQHDLTVRNTSGQVIQFLYGEDGVDSTKIEKQKILYGGGMDPLQFAMVYCFGDCKKELADCMEPSVLKTCGNWEKKTTEHFMRLVEDRELLFSKIFPRGTVEPDSITYPVGFDRILAMSHAITHKTGQLSDLDPVYAIDAIDKLVDTSVPGCSKLFGILCRMYLSPKRIIQKYHMRKTQFDRVLDVIRRRHIDAMAHAGEMVGVLAAQSIGEPLTQCTLNTFHSSGQASGSAVIGGVARIRELLSATRKIKTPSMRVVPIAEICRDKLQCNLLLNRVQTLRLSQLVVRCRIFFDPTDAATKIADDQGMLNEYAKFSQLDPHACGTGEADPRNPWVLRMELNRAAMVERGVTMAEVADAIIDAHEHRVRCVYSDDSDQQLVFRMRLDKPESDDVLTELRAFESHLLDNLVVWGVKGVDRVTMQEQKVAKYDRIAKVYEKSKEWVLYTSGTNLREILGRDGVDAHHTITNDIVEIYEVLGVEAARQALINEFTAVMSKSDINFRHVSLLVDNMTHRGRLMSVDRFGMTRSDMGVLSKASFEKSVDNIITSAVFAEKDPMLSVAANVMLGQMAPCGTGQSELTFDMDKYLHTAESLGISMSTNQVVVFESGDREAEDDDVLVNGVTMLKPSMMRLDFPSVPRVPIQIMTPVILVA